MRTTAKGVKLTSHDDVRQLVDLERERIREIAIDGSGRLLVRPAKTTFEAIFRTASGVHWDAASASLQAPKPDEWSYPRWFEQISSAAADEYDVRLEVAPDTLWSNVPDAVRHEIEEYSDGTHLEEIIAERKRQGAGEWDQFLIDQALRQADPCWDRGQFAEYVRILAPHREKLSAAQLKRLEIAEKRAD